MQGRHSWSWRVEMIGIGQGGFQLVKDTTLPTWTRSTDFYIKVRAGLNGMRQVPEDGL